MTGEVHRAYESFWLQGMLLPYTYRDVREAGREDEREDVRREREKMLEKM